jgi:TatA/E family protein of Tat protein translocase
MIPGPPQVGGAGLLILLAIILLPLGSRRVPSLARSLGSGLGEFRRGLSGEHYYEEVEDEKGRSAGGEETAAKKPTLVERRR